MDRSSPVDALRQPLAFAARDRFAHLERVRNLGQTLRGAGERLRSFLLGTDPERARALAEWLQRLEGWDGAARVERERLVAQGLLLISPAERPSPRSSPIGVEDRWDSPVTVLSGCGPKIAAHLDARGIRVVRDLLLLLPRRYEDDRQVRSVAAVVGVAEGQRVAVRGKIVRARAVPRRFFEVVVEDPDAETAPRLLARWFHFHAGMAQQFRPGAPVTLAGPLRRHKGELQMAHPDVLMPGSRGIRVLYPEIEGVPPRTLEKLVRQAALSYADGGEDFVPAAIAQTLGLPGLGEALRALHLPPDDIDPLALGRMSQARSPAHRRLAFGELFLFQLVLAQRRRQARAEPATPCTPDAAQELARLRKVLPFSPTEAQERAVAAIAADLAQSAPMMRLLQGDVGSGKTMVAFAAAHLAMATGMQAVLMAPTELLAEQHLRTMEPWAKALGWRIALLCASTPRPVRESTEALVAGGAIHLLIGTHALLSERVGFAKLGLAIVDEQHRFGVAQRARLRQKAGAPHLLVMTATPIPRTLALTAFGELDVTVIDALPPGRTPPKTRVFVGPRARSRAYAEVARLAASGQQAFVVCPLVEESEKLGGVADAVSTARQLGAAFPTLRLGLIHGKQSAAAKEEVMARFGSGQIDLLVATTVIEVGVDVPAATLMVVEHAERFGLAQLHQLRGRVGRGAGSASSCFLLTPRTQGTVAAERLRVFATETDGFAIAEADLALRGFGELFGTRQAGALAVRMGGMHEYLELLAQAREQALGLIERDPELAQAEHAPARVALARKEASIFGEEAG